MLVWEAHLALADALGDSTLINSSVIRDGVRFSKNLRDSYLYRAMLSVLNKRILQLKGFNNTQISHIVSRFFPTSIHKLQFTLSLPPSNVTFTSVDTTHCQLQFTSNTTTDPLPALVFGGRIHDLTNTSNKPLYPLPVKTLTEASGLLNGLSIQMYDNFMTIHYLVVPGVPDSWQPLIDIYSGQLDLTDDVNIQIELDIVMMPINPTSQAATDLLTIDEMYIPEVLNQAIIYMQVDSQDLEISPAFSQMNSEIDKLMIGNPQQGG